MPGRVDAGDVGGRPGRAGVFHVTPTVSQGKEEPMAFRDLFLPKIAHSKPEVRKKAVMQESDTALLQRVIDNDTDPEVVETARRRLSEVSGQPTG